LFWFFFIVLSQEVVEELKTRLGEPLSGEEDTLEMTQVTACFSHCYHYILIVNVLRNNRRSIKGVIQRTQEEGRYPNVFQAVSYSTVCKVVFDIFVAGNPGDQF
jgi:hypothetical protein